MGHKNFAFCICLAILTLRVAAQSAHAGDIHGIIFTADQRPVEGANIQLQGTRYFTVSSAQGSFDFKNVAPGNYSIKATYIGHDTTVKEIKVIPGNETNIDLQLHASQQQLGEVVVTGQYMPQSVRNSVYTVRVIDSASIRMRAPVNVQQILANETGIRYSLDPALGESDLTLNGMSGENIKILLDGVPLIDRDAARNSLNQIDVNDIQRIEMVDGPMSVVYGTDALAGVINIITKKGNNTNGLFVNARVQEESAGKEYNLIKDKGVHNEYAGLKYNTRHWYIDASGTRNNFGGWKGDTTGRPDQWLPKDQWLGNARIGYKNDALNIWNSFNYLDENIYSYGAVFNDVAGDQTYITHRYTDQLQADWKINSRLSLNSSLSYQHLQRRTLSTLFTESTGQVHLNPDPAADQALVKFSDAFFRSAASWYISSKVSLQPGVEVQWDKAFGDRIDGEPTITNYAFFVSSEIKPIDGINIRPGIRFLHNTVYPAPKAVPSINTKFRLSDNFDLRLSYGYGYRAPALRELYFSFHDVNHNIDGNPDLKAEHSNSYNGSVEWHNKTISDIDVSSTLSGFYSLFADKIELAAVDNSTEYTYINISKAKATGINWSNTFKQNNWNISAGAAYVGYYNQYKNDDVPVRGESKTFAWSPEINSNIIYNLPHIGGAIGLFYKYTGELPTYRIDDNDTLYLAKQGAFSNLDLTITKKIGKYLNLQAGVKNIFNVTTLNNTTIGSTQAHGVGGGPILQNYGRSWFVGILFQSPKIL